MKQLFTLLSILLLVGCTITKRQFNSGYHVEWKKSHSTKKNETAKLNLNELKDDPSNEPEVQLNSFIVFAVDSMDLIPSKNEELVVDQLALKETSPKEIEESEPVAVQNPQIQEKRVEQVQDEVVDEVERKTEPLTWVSLILFFGIGIAAGLIAIYSSFFYLGAGIFLAGLAIILFICALISFIRIHRHPERYKNKWLTKLVFLITILSLVAAGICLIAAVAVNSMTPMLQGI